VQQGERDSRAKRHPSRARVGLAIAVLGSVLVVAACGGDDEESRSVAGGELEADSVVYADWGGTTRSARIEAISSPFNNDTGVEVVVADADPAKLELFKENERSDWDLIDLSGWDVIRFAEQGLIEKLPSDVERLDLVPEGSQRYATGGYNAVNGIGYQTDGPAPKSWADFFDTDNFPGKRALPNYAYFQAEAALLADGVKCQDLYPLDYKRAFAKLDEIRDELVFYDSFGQGVQFLAQGSVSMALLQNSRVGVMKDQGLPVDFLWDDGFLQWSASVVPKFGPQPDAAFALADYMSQPKQQAQWSRLTKYGPMNSEAEALLDDATLEQLPNAHTDVTCEVDIAALADGLDEYTERYTEWLSQG
jgi:putative spermidine/putrescine transport system substrate-binding protein